jgi:hypothetical protein
MRTITRVKKSTTNELLDIFQAVNKIVTNKRPKGGQKTFDKALDAAVASILKDKSVSSSVLHPYRAEARRVKADLLDLFKGVQQSAIEELGEKSGKNAFGSALRTARFVYSNSGLGAKNNG